VSGPPEPLERYAAATLRLAQAAGAKPASLEMAVAALDRSRPLLPEANPVWLPAGAGPETVRIAARLLHERGGGRALCHLPEGAPAMRQALENQGFDVQALAVIARGPGAPAEVPAGFALRPVDSDRDRMAWEQILVEDLAELEEPASRAAHTLEWLGAAGGRLWLGVQGEAPAVAAALAPAGDSGFVPVLVERPVMRRRGLGLGALTALGSAAPPGAEGPLIAAIPWEEREQTGGLRGAVPGGRILRFALEAAP